MSWVARQIGRFKVTFFTHAPWKLSTLTSKTSSTLFWERFRHLGMILYMAFSDCLWINDNINLTGQVSDQFSCIHSGNLEAEKQFCFYIAPDRNLINMVPAPKNRRYRFYSVPKTGQFFKFICFQEPLLVRMKRCPHRNFNCGDTFMFFWVALAIIRAVFACRQWKRCFALLGIFVIYTALGLMTGCTL